jgi:hypothetical protein
VAALALWHKGIIADMWHPLVPLVSPALLSLHPSVRPFSSLPIRFPVYPSVFPVCISIFLSVRMHVDLCAFACSALVSGLRYTLNQGSGIP